MKTKIRTFIRSVFLLAGGILLANVVPAGDEVNNGGGLGEKNVTYAYLQLERPIEICLNSRQCHLDLREKQILLSILSSLHQEYKNPDQLQFLSGKKNPEFFKIDGQIKLAKTGDRVGDSIYINMDLLNLYEENGEEEEGIMGLGAATGMLIHELGHHQGIKDHALLDLLGQKVSLAMQDTINVYSPFPHMKKVFLLTLTPKKMFSFSTVLLYVGEDIFDLTDFFKKELHCPLHGQVQGAKIFNAYWSKVKMARKEIQFELTGHLRLQCQGEGPKRLGDPFGRGNMFSLIFQAERTGRREFPEPLGPLFKFRKLNLLPHSLQLTQFKDNPK